MALRYYANAPATTLASSCSNSATTIQVASITGFPIQYPFTLIIDRGTASEEAVSVTSSSGVTLTVTRAIDSTTAFAHTIGATVDHGITAQDVRESNDHINGASVAHTKAQVGLGNVDNTSDVNKPVSTATAAALSLKLDTSTAVTIYAPRVFYVDPPVNIAATDKAAINAKIALANVAGGVVQLRPGTYYIDGALTALANGVTIQGHGPLSTVIRSTHLTADFITSNGAFLIGVKDVQLESLVTRTAGAGIAFTNVEGYIVDNVRFIDCYNAATFNGCHSGWLSRIKLAAGTAVTNRGFYWVSCTDTHVQQVLINGGTTALGAGKAWLHIDSGCDTWAGVDVGAAASSGSGTCLLLTHSLSPASFAPRWIKLTNFWFEGAHAGVQGSNGIEIQAATNAYFTNGYSSSGSSGIYATGGSDLTFNQVIIMNNWLFGAVMSNVTQVVFRDCNFDSNSRGGNAAASHLFVGGTTQGLRVRDCTFSNAVLGNANKVTYAIEHSVALAQDTQVSGCKFTASDYAIGTLGGTAPLELRLRDNAGLNPAGNIASPAIPASTVAYTNKLGYDCTVIVVGGTVSIIAVDGATTGLTSGTFRVPVGKTITLTYTVAPTWKWYGD